MCSPGWPKTAQVLPSAGSSYPVSNSAPSQAARETRRESSSMLAGGAPGTVWDDSRCVPCGVACLATPRGFPRCTARPRLAARGSMGQISPGTRPAPAAPAGPKGEVILLSVQNLPVAGRARKRKVIGRRWLGWCIRAIGVRSLPLFSRAEAFASIGSGAPHVRVQGGRGAKTAFF